MILAIDPGTTESGWALMRGKKVIACGIDNNQVAMRMIIKRYQPNEIACEMIASYGMAVGQSTFETCVWIGEFRRIAKDDNINFKFVYRKEVCMFLCGSARAKDKNIRQAIIDMYEPTGGGKTPQVGTKKQPGPLYGVSSHIWPSIAVGLTYQKITE